MRRLLLLALVVPLFAGCGGARHPVPGTVHEGLRSEMLKNVLTWVRVEHLPQIAVPGAQLFAVSGCTACHDYNGVGGGGMLGAPDLTAEGAPISSIKAQIRHLECPSCVHPGSPMPPFKSLGQKRLRELALFLVYSKGSSSHPTEGAGDAKFVPSWVVREKLPPNAVPGATLFATIGCTACHTYLGYGTRHIGAPDLTAEGKRVGSIKLQIRHLKCPTCVHPGSLMPPFGVGLSPKRLRELALFLVDSKGPR